VKDNIKIDFKATRYKYMKCIYVAQYKYQQGAAL